MFGKPYRFVLVRARLRFAVEDREHAPDRFLAIGPARGRREVDVEPRLPGEADERPVVGEPPAVDVAQMVEHHAAGGAEARRHLEQLGQFLRSKAARWPLLWRLQAAHQNHALI